MVQGQGFEAELMRLAERLKALRLRLVTAESCTGGWIGKLCSDQAGSSAWFEAAIATYSDSAKQALLGVDDDTLRRCGAVSREVVLEMAAGALERVAGAEVAIAVSGIAGPSGGTPDKPVGTVWIVWQCRGLEPAVRCFQLQGGRDAVRFAAARIALTELLDYLA